MFPMDSTNEICQAVRAWLKTHGKSITQAARDLGVTQGAVTNQLSGRPFGPKAARQYAGTFGFSKAYLLTGEGSLVPPAAPLQQPEEAAASTPDGVFLPRETLHLYTSMADSIQRLTCLVEKLTDEREKSADASRVRGAGYHNNRKQP